MRAGSGAAAVVFGAAITLIALGFHQPADDAQRPDSPVTIEVGSICKSLVDHRYEVSCGTTAFGDTRYDCTKRHLGKCAVTTAVILRNVSGNTVAVTTVSGARQGDRRLSSWSALEPGRALSVRPLPDGGYLFDILVRSAGPRRGAVRVESVS